jgi:hypothetical protein
MPFCNNLLEMLAGIDLYEICIISFIPLVHI